MPLCLLWYYTARCCSWTCLDEQYDWFCFSISLTGILLFVALVKLTFINRRNIFFSIVNHFYISFCLKFIREYSGKVDELIKDKIEAQNEEKAKEREEKDVLAQQVPFLKPPFTRLLYCLFDIELTVVSIICRICMPSCYLLLCRHHQCQEWEEVMPLPHLHHLWVEWGCHQCLLLACLQWVAATNLPIHNRGENFAIFFYWWS